MNNWKGIIESNGTHQQSYFGLLFLIVIAITGLWFMYTYMIEMFYVFLPFWIISFFVGFLIPQD
jgi:hypothetical protein